MGQTRAKKSKKASKGVEDASSTVSKDFESLTIHNSSAPSNHINHNNSQQSSSQNDHSNSSESDSDGLAAELGFIDVRNTEDRGFAVFATRKIPAGTLILAETPLCRLTQAEEDADKPVSNTNKLSVKGEESALSKQFAGLSKPVQKSYLTLFDSEKSGFSKVKSIYYSNCYNLSGSNKPSKSSLGGSCIGMLASRINHSCIPNVQFSFDEARNLMLFHAIKAIPRNREVLSNYDSIYEVKVLRQKRQMLYYGFRCSCEACEPGLNEFWSRSDERRRAMIDARRDIKTCEEYFEENEKLNVGMDPIGTLQKLEGVLIKEGLAGLPLADTYRSLAKWTDRIGDRRESKKWRIKESEVCSTCLGKRSLRVKDLKVKLDQVD